MQRFIINTILFLVSLLLSLALLDVFIDITGISDKSYNDVYDDIGRGRRAGVEFTIFGEGFSIGSFNQYRYLGPGYGQEKPVNTIRIALLGDSFVEGFQVFDRSHFRRILEEELEDKGLNNIQILNFGRSGFDIGDMYAYNERFVKTFNPDISLFFISGGDLKPLFNDPLRLKVYHINDSLQIKEDFPPNYIIAFNRLKWLIQNSTIFNMLNNGRKLAMEEGMLKILLDKLYPYKISAS